MRCRRVRFTRAKRVGYCWIGRCLIISGSAENRGNSWHLSDQPTPAQASLLRSSPRPELYLLNAAAQMRRKLFAEDTDKWGKVIRAANIKPE
jgi:hypothetical protein